MNPGARALAGGVEARDARAPVEVRDDSAHRVVGCGSDRNRRLCGLVALRTKALHQAGEPAAVDRPQVEQCRSPLANRPRDHVSRCQLVGEALAAGVDEKCPFPAERLRE